ncbi:XRE family transcriptional regulator [Streptomyces minutiscleroticus]|uniref:MmyB family transcriptional regulator n=1 Tax=Streptomyces minutiscleroticus TaxID=68238 RepID=UPI00331E432C
MPAADLEVQQILRARRRALSPEEVGLPARPPGRRGPRVKGLTQDEVETLTNRRGGYYSRVESGRIPLTAEYLLTLSRALRLRESEYIYIHLRVFGTEPLVPLDPDAGRCVPPVWQRAVNAQREMAYVNDRAFNIVMYNEAFAEMFPSGKPPKNAMEWMLLSDEARDHTLVDWDTAWGPLVLPQFRAALAAHPDDADLLRIQEQILADDRALRLHQRTTNSVELHPDGDRRPLRHAVRGLGQVTMIASQPLSAPGSRYMTILFDPAEVPSAA